MFPFLYTYNGFVIGIEAHTISVVITHYVKGGCSFMARRRGMMSDQLKEEIAKELGFYDTVQREGWGGIKARDAGNMVKRAIEKAEASMQQGKP